MALIANIAASAFPRCPRAASGIVGVLLVALVGCEPPRASNYNVNEHNFLRAWAAGADAQIATILGNPDASGEHALVQVPGNVGAEVLYSIAETCDQPDKDRFRYFRGVNNEQIRLLVSGRTNTLIAAEYLVDGTPVFYLGPKAGGRMLGGQPRDRARGDAEFLARKKQLVEFFSEQLSKPAATAAASPSADSTLFGQPDGLRYSIFDAQLKGDTLVVSVKIENITDLRKVSYAPCRPTLADFAGNAYASKGCSPDCGKSLYPHETHVVDYTFEKPVPGVESFCLTFSRPMMDPRTHFNRMLSTVLPLGSDQIAPAASDQAGHAVGAVPGGKALPAAPRWRVSLPHSFKLSPELTDMPADWVDKFYPCGSTPWVEIFADGATHMVVSMRGGRLHGASTWLYPNGKISALAVYVNGSLSGPLRLWDQNGGMVLYSEYVNGKRTGLTVAFQCDKPVFVQVWDGGRLTKEYAVEGHVAKPVSAGTEGAGADEIHQQLKQLSVQVSQNGERLKKFAATIAVRARAMGGSTPSGGPPRGPASQFRAALNAAYKVPVRKAGPPGAT